MSEEVTREAVDTEGALRVAGSGGKFESLGYRGKHYTIPVLSKEGYVIAPTGDTSGLCDPPADSPIIQCLNTVWDLEQFKTARKPVRVAMLEGEERAKFSTRGVAPRTLDMPIKFPGSAFRVPREFEQFLPVIRKVAEYERAVNSACFDEYYCYLTVDQAVVKPGKLQREAPAHVDGFQGARWSPKVRLNHTYVVSDAIPTAYYAQPFDFSKLDEAKHNFFWEMNRQIAQTNSEHAWYPEAFELSMMDAYCVHRGDAATVETFRTWIRLSFEVRIFDRLGNAHNPMFSYDWPMVPRDIESLDLVPYDDTMDPSLRVFPWQKTDGTAHDDRTERTSPNLKPKGP